MEYDELDGSELLGPDCHWTWSIGVPAGGGRLKASSVLPSKSANGIFEAGVEGEGSVLCCRFAGGGNDEVFAVSNFDWMDVAPMFSLSSSFEFMMPVKEKARSFFFDWVEIRKGAEGIFEVVATVWQPA